MGNLIQITILLPTTVGKNLIEGMDQPSQSTEESMMHLQFPKVTGDQLFQEGKPLSIMIIPSPFLPTAEELGKFSNSQQKIQDY